jgi:Rrf2 family cysteine metabolism transcriptional repressor
MRLTSRSEYALLALIYLARQDPAEFISVDTIATEQDIPSRFLEQIMLTLKRGRYLRSAKGRHGGYCLAKPPEAITLAEIVRLFNGKLAPTESVSKYFYEPTPIEHEANLVAVFQDIRDTVAQKLEATTLADVC